jgi:hypothetical protein
MNITSIRYINMDQNWHRKLFMKSLLKPMSYKVVRCPGVKFDIENKAYDKYLKCGVDANLESAKANGVVGCWIAHSHALEEVTEQEGITIVLEDDFICKAQFLENALKMVNAFDKDFDVILFDTWGAGPLEAHKIAEDIYHTQNYGFPYYGGTHCLFVNNARIPKILDAKLNSQVMDYDGFLLTSGKLNTYVFHTGECSLRTTGSDINPHFKVKYDILGLLTCMLPPAWRERTKRFKKYFRKAEGKKPIRISGDQLKNFEGYYHVQGQKDAYIKFVVKEDTLMLIQLWDGREVPLLPSSELDFFSTAFTVPLKFFKDEHGEINEVLAFYDTVCKKVRKAITLTPAQLKAFEGKYQERQNSAVAVQITAMNNHLFIKQLWDGMEFCFEPESDLAFFAKDNPSFPIRFSRDKDGAIVQVIAFERDTLDKIEV